MGDVCGGTEARERLVEGLSALALTFDGSDGNDGIVLRTPGGEILPSVDEGLQVGALSISMTVRPSDDDTFVQFVCRVAVGDDCRLAGVDVLEQRGLDCASEARIRWQLSERLASDEDLVSLFFYAMELADEHNKPHGICSLCREALVGVDGGVGDGEIGDGEIGDGGRDILRFACFHCFHADCFWDWYDWKQLRLAEKVAELRDDHNNNQVIVAKAMQDAEIEVAEGSSGVSYVLQCPNCRERMWPLPDRGPGEVGERRLRGPVEVSVDDLSADLREMVRRLQIQQAAGLERQRRVGGVVSSEK